MTILSTIEGISMEEIEERYKGQGYAQFKLDVAEAVVKELEPVQKRVKELLDNKGKLEEIFKDGAEKANYVATKTLRKMQKKIGLVQY